MNSGKLAWIGCVPGNCPPIARFRMMWNGLRNSSWLAALMFTVWTGVGFVVRSMNQRICVGSHSMVYRWNWVTLPALNVFGCWLFSPLAHGNRPVRVSQNRFWNVTVSLLRCSMMSISPQLDQFDAIVSKREIGALKSAVAVSSHASPIIQNAGHVAVALGIAIRASIRPNVHERLPFVVSRPERWNQLRPEITVAVEK